MKEFVNEIIELGDTIIELKDKLEKIKEIVDKYNIGKYDYSIPPIGIIELKQILEGKENER